MKYVENSYITSKNDAVKYDIQFCQIAVHVWLKTG